MIMAKEIKVIEPRTEETFDPYLLITYAVIGAANMAPRRVILMMFNYIGLELQKLWFKYTQNAN
jgi:hypothetical protein